MLKYAKIFLAFPPLYLKESPLHLGDLVERPSRTGQNGLVGNVQVDGGQDQTGLGADERINVGLYLSLKHLQLVVHKLKDGERRMNQMQRVDQMRGHINFSAQGRRRHLSEGSEDLIFKCVLGSLKVKPVRGPTSAGVSCKSSIVLLHWHILRGAVVNKIPPEPFGREHRRGCE